MKQLSTDAQRAWAERGLRDAIKLMFIAQDAVHAAAISRVIGAVGATEARIEAQEAFDAAKANVAVWDAHVESVK
jgi:pyrroloquinoline quinone (PQQ) biosynthesis protein C